MNELLGSIWWLIVVLGLLVTFHEFGHFWVARRCGVKVLRFSIGFGHPLLKKTGRDGTEYVVAAIPLGGYVKMLDERETEVMPSERHLAFNRKSLAARTAIVAAGPVFNLIFAIIAFWIMFLVGTPELRPIIGATSSLAARSDIPPDSQITAIDGKSIQTWSHVILGLVGPALDQESARLSLETLDGQRLERELDFGRLQRPVDEQNLLNDIGIIPWQLSMEIPAIIGEFGENSPAEEAGIQLGDEIVDVGGDSIDSWFSLIRALDRNATPGNPLDVGINRNSNYQTLSVIPISDARGQRALLGIGVSAPDETELMQFKDRQFIWKHGAITAIGAAGNELWRLTTTTLGMLGRMVTGKASLQNLSGPITIAQLANSSAGQGLSRFLFFLGLVSLSLAILNLLPIPVLDGGHLLYFAVEFVTGKPVTERVQLIGQSLGLLLLGGLMLLAITNDVVRLFN